MYIMVQDKSRLVKVDEIKVEKTLVKGVKANECEVVLGRYGSDDRAYGVLNNICDLISNKYQTDVINRTTRTTGKLVFVMPQK